MPPAIVYLMPSDPCETFIAYSTGLDGSYATTFTVCWRRFTRRVK